MPFLEAKQLSIGYDVPLVTNIDFSCEQGELIALVGRNGEGKTTLFKSLAGLLPIHAGEVVLAGKNLADWSIRDRAKKLALVFTERHSLGGFDVRSYVALGRHPYRKAFARLDKRDEEVIDRSIEATGLQNLQNRSLDRLSDGERQRAALARALAQDTPIIMLDEPTAFLDYPGKIEVLNYLKTLSKEHQKLILFSTHELPLVAGCADGLIYIGGGEVEKVDGVKGEIGRFLGERFGVGIG
jgi:iron complex transport system ATP-binding protein